MPELIPDASALEIICCYDCDMAPLYYIIWKEGKYYVSQCLNVDVASFGDSRQQAIDNLNEAIALYFEEKAPMQHEMIEHPEIISVPQNHA